MTIGRASDAGCPAPVAIGAKREISLVPDMIGTASQPPSPYGSLLIRQWFAFQGLALVGDFASHRYEDRAQGADRLPAHERLADPKWFP